MDQPKKKIELSSQTIPILMIIVMFTVGFWRITSDSTKLCHFARASWSQRHDMVLALTEDSKLADGIDPASPQGIILQAQIDHSNAVKDAKRTKLLDEGGKQATC